MSLKTSYLITAASAGLVAAAATAGPLGLRLRRQHQAITHDPLTGLFNRAGFTRAIRSASPGMWLVAADCNRFKVVNDTLGHTAGDQVLQALAARMRRLVATTGVAGRFGGDEFVLLCSAEQLAAIGAGVLAVTATGADGQAMPVTMAAGATLFGPAEDFGVQLGRADAASYRAKATGAPLAVFDPAADDHPATIQGDRPAVRVRDLDQWATAHEVVEAVA
ncbi:GGDEF domain-containing protein [Glycomyces sp. TRM65418]|uniref:GGDEF domain-containing protein n=1 Tax=Glycomyces sp. TRM65418 TaxID=2867006 RepID=UPI001CE61D54|nr:GGDEF domain-containing protein [Glycomyces sp. TRM65418]MCC3762457.1 GGDEF domain-containing protein [Glycomyces sp. TRM65418]QZD56501.1 GGDEF domain-containing protein [Glycomyces sp. TRM65418]